MASDFWPFPVVKPETKSFAKVRKAAFYVQPKGEISDCQSFRIFFNVDFDLIIKSLKQLLLIDAENDEPFCRQL